MPFLSKFVTRCHKESQLERGEENSFHTEIDALKLRGGSSGITVTEAGETVEELDKLTQRILDKGEKEYCLRVLDEVCRKHIILPRSYTIFDVRQRNRWRSNGAAEIWTGELGQERVCIKAFRRLNDEDVQDFKRELYSLSVRWKNISHPNVLRFLGVYESENEPCFGLIAPRMLDNIKDYTRRPQGGDRLLLLADAACGLTYLHSLDIVHGGVNPGNVLITPQGRACIGDFGVAKIINNPRLVALQSGTSNREYDSIRYMAPEQLDESKTRKESDVHSFAITAYEVLVEIKPYPAVTGGGPLSAVITGGTRPFRPENEVAVRWLTDDMWSMLESCWNPNPSTRPTMVEVHQAFQEPNAPVDPEAQVGTAPVGTAQVRTAPQAKGRFLDWLRGLSCFYNEDFKENDTKQ